MTSFHPDINWLVDYAAGSMAQSHALCINVHLQHCEECRAKTGQLAAVGASLVSGVQAPAALERSTVDAAPASGDTSTAARELDELLEKIDDLEKHGDAADAPATDNTLPNEFDLPGSVAKLAFSKNQPLRWKRLGRSLSVAPLACGDMQREVALHRLRPGGGVANHDHRGDEVTVVLQGSFSDQQGLYQPGDFLLRKEGEQHRPIATGNSDCLCLSVVDAPIKFTGPFMRLLNPFIKIHPSAA